MFIVEGCWWYVLIIPATFLLHMCIIFYVLSVYMYYKYIFICIILYLYVIFIFTYMQMYYICYIYLYYICVYICIMVMHIYAYNMYWYCQLHVYIICIYINIYTYVIHDIMLIEPNMCPISVHIDAFYMLFALPWISFPFLSI